MSVRRIARVARIAVVVGLVGLLVLGVAAWLTERHLWAQTDSISGAFDGLSDRPPAAPGDSETILVVLRGVGVADAETWVGGPTSGLVVLHVDAARQEPVAISVPVSVEGPVPGHDPTPLREVAALGGPSLMVATVEGLTGVRMDHVVVVDWRTLAELADHIGGIDVDVSAETTDPDRSQTWTIGRHHLTGAEVLAFVGQERGLDDPPVDRAHRQQVVLRALLDDALAQEMRKEPWLVYRFLDTLTSGVALDDTWSKGEVRGLAWSLRSMRSAWVVYAVVPLRTDTEIDAERAGGLWQAFEDDRVGAWVARHPDVRTPQAVT